jgi:hypothetical protein
MYPINTNHMQLPYIYPDTNTNLNNTGNLNSTLYLPSNSLTSYPHPPPPYGIAYPSTNIANNQYTLANPTFYQTITPGPIPAPATATATGPPSAPVQSLPTATITNTPTQILSKKQKQQQQRAQAKAQRPPLPSNYLTLPINPSVYSNNTSNNVLDNPSNSTSFSAPNSAPNPNVDAETVKFCYFTKI